jgi:WS/DGAT/MGAT family acyltransferase
MTSNTAALTPLSGLDALFLQLESPEMPMHVGSLSLLELPKGYRGDFLRDLRKMIGSRLHLADVFRRKLVPMPLGLANPAWMRANDIELDHHIRRVTLPRPGTLAQLEACVGRLHSQRLDRSRPLWELVVIDGLGGRLAGHVGYYAKVHHAAIDGQAGVALAQAMLDPTPIPRAVPPPPDEPSVDAPGIVERLRLAASQSARQLKTLARLVPVAAEAIGGMLRADASTGQSVVRATTRREGAPLLGPRTPLNVSISSERAFATASLPLAQVRHVARALDASVNDIVLATCSGALRRWLAAHGGVPRKPISAGVPFSVRGKGDASASNKVSMMRAGLATHLADADRRLAEIHASMSRGKAVTGSLRALVPTDYPSLGSAWVVGGLAWLVGAVGHRLPVGTHLPSLAPVAISNVPGPPMTLYVAGARVVHYWPASIVVHGVALNITVQSYADWLDIGLTACRRAVPDLSTFRKHLAGSFAELQALVPDMAPAPVSPTRASTSAAVARWRGGVTAASRVAPLHTATKRTVAGRRRPVTSRETAGRATTSGTSSTAAPSVPASAGRTSSKAAKLARSSDGARRTAAVRATPSRADKTTPDSARRTATRRR